MLRSREEADRLVLEIVAGHADSLLRVARRHSLCPDDAQDAYQRMLEIMLRHAPRLDAERAYKYAHTVVKHEAMRVRDTRSRTVAGEEPDFERHEASTVPAPEEQVLAFDRMTRSAEALQRLKPQELRALWLKAQGLSYHEIADRCGWTYTKVNRCITEGRRSFLERYAHIESGAECRRWEPVLSAIVDGEATAADLAQARPHLRNCQACRATIRNLREGSAPLAILLPLPAAAAALPHVEPAGRLLSRIYEAFAGQIHERAVSSAMKWQAGADALTGGKLAAVAASAAALAGGGVAVDRAVEHTQHRTHRVAAAHVAHLRPAPAAHATAGRTTASVSLPAPERPGPPRPKATVASAKRAEFGFAGRHKRSAKASTASAEGDPAAAEFASATAAPSASSAAAPAAQASASPEESTAAREFGG